MINIKGSAVRELAEAISTNAKEIIEDMDELKRITDVLGETYLDETYNSLKSYVMAEYNRFIAHTEDFLYFKDTLIFVADKIDAYNNEGSKT